jgi:hypothetical protein
VGHLGEARLVGQFSYDTLPSRSRDGARASIATASNLKSFIDELIESPRAMQQAASLVDLAGKPLIVLTAGREYDAAWLSVGISRISGPRRHG